MPMQMINLAPYLDHLPVDIKDSLSEVYSDRGLNAAGELSGGESVCKARLAHRRVPNHKHFEGPAAAQQRRYTAQRVGQLQGGLHSSDARSHRSGLVPSIPCIVCAQTAAQRRRPQRKPN